MKTITATIIILALFLTVSAQKKMTDREFEGFKGNVKSVSIETMPMSDSGNPKNKNKRVVWEKWSYDKDGRKTEEYNPQGKSKVTFTVKDGFKISKLMLEEGENSETLNRKFVYEYDSKGRVKTAKEYLQNGNLVSDKSLKYDENGRVKEETVTDPVSSTKVVYKYNQKGNLIEMLEEKTSKLGVGTKSKTKIVYSDYKVDAHGNWTQRKTTLYYGDTVEPYVSMDYQVFTYYP